MADISVGSNVITNPNNINTVVVTNTNDKTQVGCSIDVLADAINAQAGGITEVGDGLSESPQGTVVLGNDVGDTEATLTSNREIPLGGFNLNLTGTGGFNLGTTTGAGRLTVRSSAPNTYPLQIQNSLGGQLFNFFENGNNDGVLEIKESSGRPQIFLASSISNYTLNSFGVKTSSLSNTLHVRTDIDFGGITIDGAGGFATYFAKISGTVSAVRLTANTAGIIGNSISLTFDGTNTITQAITAWNAANPSNQITLTAGDGSQIPTAQVLNMTGGQDVNNIGLTLNHTSITNGKIWTLASSAGNSGFGTGKLHFINQTDSPATPVITLTETGQVGLSNVTPDASAKFQVDSTTQGILGVRLTTIQRDAIVGPAEGLHIWNTTTKRPNWYDGTQWILADGTPA